jgi:geranylgeranyl reductase family protein
MYDVIIVGAGPGGASAAYYLSKAGMRVLVLEKEAIPRYKACGGGLSLQMLQKYFPFSFDPVIEDRVQRVSYALGEHEVSISLDGQSMAMVMRDRFDAYILSQAQVEVEQCLPVQSVREYADRVTVTAKDGRSFEARYLIGADGASSIVAKSMGLRRGKELAAAIEIETPVSESVMQRFHNAPLFIFGEIRTGYLWVFPKADHLSVGIAALHPKRGEMQSILRQVMSRYGIDIDNGVFHGHPLPFYTGREHIATSRVLLVGDAAGLIDPFSGEGIRLAIKSASLASKAIASGQVSNYQRSIDRHIGFSQKLGLGLGQLFYALPDVCFELGVRNPLATPAFIDLFSDKVGYPQVLLRIFGTLPYGLLRNL